ncbi:helix-turn-helix domain-containing protein [Myxococcus sp. CA056]|uniref:helix-turn-helix domain-containing protein n=1 Tax=Myxococcus sp. CA056 TaxID=2741740 RepID=UPI00157A5C54|nr:helix-turn-helix domain-containing protein [Myxococcus sp. CA056]NTX13561.1 helix-turn-helix domain-containing protein [Myxococcus sp. CA056]
MKPFAQQTYYELLEVPVTAQMEEIHAAYSRLMELYAPDSIAVYALVDADQVDALRARMTEAMEILTDADLRVEYDKDLGLPARKVAEAVTAPAKDSGPVQRAAEALASAVESSASSSASEAGKGTEEPEPELSGPAAFRASFVSGYSLSYVTSSLQSAPFGGGFVDMPAAGRVDVGSAPARGESAPANVVEARTAERVVAQSRAAGSASVEPGADSSAATSSAVVPASAAAEASNSEAPDTASATSAQSVPGIEAPTSASAVTAQAASSTEAPDSASAVTAQAASSTEAPDSASSVAAQAASSTEAPDTASATSAQTEPSVEAAIRASAVAAQAASSTEGSSTSTAESAGASAEAQGAEVPASPLASTPAPAEEPPVDEAPVASNAQDASAQPVAPVSAEPPAPEPATSIVVTPTTGRSTGTSRSMPSTASGTGASAQTRGGSGRQLGEAQVLSQDSAIATAEAALAQVSARVRDVRPRLPDIPADAEFNGELLRRVRETRGFTLHQVADRTRISLRHLENVEADRYTLLPPPVYLRGILMNLARELGLDPLQVSRSYLGLASEKSGKK